MRVYALAVSLVLALSSGAAAQSSGSPSSQIPDTAADNAARALEASNAEIKNMRSCAGAAAAMLDDHISPAGDIVNGIMAQCGDQIYAAERAVALNGGMTQAQFLATLDRDDVHTERILTALVLQERFAWRQAQQRPEARQ